MIHSDASTTMSTPPRTVRSPTIAVIGMEGSGKTVLATTLAKRLCTIDARGVFLNPKGVKTLKYVERVWGILQSGDWPPSTVPGEKFELEWKLNIVGEQECDLRLIDVAGQDLRLLFGEEQIYSVDSLPAHLQALAEYCRSADIILFLVNLKDFCGEGDAERRTANEAAIKSAMDYLTTVGHRRRVCLVLTQADLYKELAHERGGWLALVKQVIPYVFNAHVAIKKMVVHPIAAVAETRIVVDGDGRPRQVPVAQFRSAGFGGLVNWLTAQVRKVKQELQADLSAHIPPDHNPLSGNQKKQTEWLQIAMKYVWIIIILLLYPFARSCSSPPFSAPTKQPPIVVVRPEPELFDFEKEVDPGDIFYDLVTVKGKVINKGTSGRIIVEAWLVGEDNSLKKQEFNLNPGEVKPFIFYLHGNLGQSHEVKWRPSVP